MPITAKDIENQVIAYVSYHYSEMDLTLDKTAERLGYSTRTLQRCLHACGNRWLAILNTARAEAGHKLLVSTDKSIISIANEVGYLTPAAFRKHYANRYHVSPAHARMEARDHGTR